MKLKVPSGEVVQIDTPADFQMLIAKLENHLETVREDIRFLKRKAKQIGEWPVEPAAKPGAAET